MFTNVVKKVHGWFSKEASPTLSPQTLAANTHPLSDYELEEKEYTTESNVAFAVEVHSTIQERFLAFHEANPDVYNYLREFALVAKHSGYNHYSISSLFERLRWHYSIELRTEDFSLNNSYRSRYARLLMEKEPELRGFFHTRELVAA